MNIKIDLTENVMFNDNGKIPTYYNLDLSKFNITVDNPIFGHKNTS